MFFTLGRKIISTQETNSSRDGKPNEIYTISQDYLSQGMEAFDPGIVDTFLSLN